MPTNRVTHALSAWLTAHDASTALSAAKSAYAAVETSGRKFFVHRRREEMLRAMIAYRASVRRLTYSEQQDLKQLIQSTQRDLSSCNLPLSLLPSSRSACL